MILNIILSEVLSLNQQNFYPFFNNKKSRSILMKRQWLNTM